MSTTAEYYIRNMSTAEFERFYSRLRSRDRADTTEALRAEVDRNLERALSEERGTRAREVRALRDGIEGVRAQMEERAACNARMIDALAGRLEDFRRQGAEQHARALRAIELLRDESAALKRHLDETRERVQRVEQRASALERAFDEDRARREAAARRVGGHADALRSLASAALDTVAADEARRLGLADLRARALAAMEQARSHEAAGAREAAAATLASAQRTAAEVADQHAIRADEERAALGAVGLSLAAARVRLRELAAEDVRRFLGPELDRHARELGAIEAAAAATGASWHERKAKLDDARERATRLARDTGSLHARYEELVQQATAREAVLRGLVEALVEVWGAEFEMDVDYAVRDDARSPIVFKTKRGPYAPNVQATIGLDGRMEVHFTGYRGTECAGDLEAVRHALHRASAVKLVEGAVRVEPGRPNPPDVGPVNLGPVDLARPVTSGAVDAQRRGR